MKYQRYFKTFIISIFLFNSSLGYCASYLSLKNGNITQEGLSYDIDAKEVATDLAGTTFGIEVGHFLTNSLAIEFGYTNIKQEKVEVERISPTAFSYESDGEMSIINLGFRWFLADFLNIRFGGTKTEFNPHLEGTGVLASLENEVIDDRGQYYGVGVGYTMTRLQIFLDYTIYPNEDGKNSESTNLGIRLFF